MRKSYNVLSKKALAAVFATAALTVPVVASAETPVQEEVTPTDVYFDIDGSVYKVSLTDYAEYLLFDNEEFKELIGSNPVASINANGKAVSLTEYAEYLLFEDGSYDELPAVEYENVSEVAFNEDGTITVTPGDSPEVFEVIEISAINETSVEVTFPSDAVTEEDLEGKTITLTDGESELTATFESLDGDVATFVLDGEDVLVDATTYTVAADWATLEKSEFVAKVVDEYAATFEEVSNAVVAGAGAGAELYVQAYNQYGEKFDTKDSTVEISGSINEIVPLKGAEVIEFDKTSGKVTIKGYTLNVDDELSFTLTVKDAEGKVLSETTIEYTVIEGEDSVLTSIQLNADKTEVASGESINFTVVPLDQYNNPATPGEYTWVVNGEVVTDAKDTEYTLTKSEPGEYVVQVASKSNTKINATQTVTVGAAKLDSLKVLNESKQEVTIASGKYNKEEVVLGTIDHTEGADVSAEDIKFDIETTTEGVTADDVTVAAEYDEEDEVIVVKATANVSGVYKITPYIGESLDAEDVVAAKAITLTTTKNPAIKSISSVTFDEKELKVGSTLNKEITITNVNGETLSVGADADITADAVKAAITNSATGQASSDVTVSVGDTDEDGKTFLQVNATEDGTYVVTLTAGAKFTPQTYTLTFVEATVTTINAGADVKGTIAGDAKTVAYNALTFADQDGIALNVAAEDTDLSLKATNEKGDDVTSDLVSFTKEITTTDGVTTADTATGTDIVKGIKVAPAAGLDEGTYTVEVTYGENEDAVTDSFTVEVKAARALETVKATVAAAELSAGAETEISIVPEDQYGDVIEGLDNDAFTLEGGEGIVTVDTVKFDKEAGAYKAKVTANEVGTATLTAKVTENGEPVAAEPITVEVKEASELIHALEIEEVSTQNNSNTDDAEVTLKAIAKDADGKEVAVAQTDVQWSVVEVIDEAGQSIALTVTNNAGTKKYTGDSYYYDEITVTIDENGKLTASKDVTIKVTAKAESFNDTEATTVVEFDKTPAKFVSGLTATLEGKEVDTSEELELTSEGLVLTFTGTDQYGDDTFEIPTDLATILVDHSAVAKAEAQSENEIKITQAVGVEDGAKTTITVRYGGETLKFVVVAEETPEQN